MKSRGTFLGIPYDWRWPPWKRIKQTMWNKKDHRVFPPKAFGWGYSVNVYELIYHRRTFLLAGIFTFILLGAIFLNQVVSLNLAHSTFENYAAFRGCAKVTKRTATYGTCVTHSGQTMKIVKYTNNKWYLDGDLPCGFLCF